ncbi:CpsD/CapB family tyrosine-protein kinase [Acholeplasma vituli]|uniref:non-specific protein-tyrosine kinase n=1 Tax=Paracholeplasma vituli TaxID=69473 RepID=A0ABT2PU64_9MOLU|nr:CpsD/CapB family tyrosine-protein kinase [Paracholeplasma vituli]MCU0104390.1 CpsD/CapB family tyrosine-protein kinase [Paracholeplasma vituli]
MKLFSKKLESRYDYLVSKEAPTSFVTEQLQKMIVNLEYANVDGQYKIIQFTSSMQSESKTTLISNVAYLLASRGKRVLVVDLDLRRPKVNRIHSVVNKEGLADYLLGRIDKKQLIRKSEDGIDYIITGEKTTSVVQILESHKLKDLFENLRADYDYILLDTPPVIVVSDALLINRIADGVVFVVAHGQAKKTMIKEAINSLTRNNCTIIGICMTQDKVSKGKKYGYTYKYYSND